MTANRPTPTTNSDTCTHMTSGTPFCLHARRAHKGRRIRTRTPTRTPLPTLHRPLHQPTRTHRRRIHRTALMPKVVHATNTTGTPSSVTPCQKSNRPPTIGRRTAVPAYPTNKPGNCSTTRQTVNIAFTSSDTQPSRTSAKRKRRSRPHGEKSTPRPTHPHPILSTRSRSRRTPHRRTRPSTPNNPIIPHKTSRKPPATSHDAYYLPYPGSTRSGHILPDRALSRTR